MYDLTRLMRSVRKPTTLPVAVTHLCIQTQHMQHVETGLPAYSRDVLLVTSEAFMVLTLIDLAVMHTV